MLLKANLKDLITQIDKKAGSEEVSIDVQHIKQSLQKNHKEFRCFSEEQEHLNKYLTLENQLIRLQWKNG